MTRKRNYLAINWNDLVYYDEESPTFLKWKYSYGYGKSRTIKDNKAGYIHKATKSACIKYKGDSYFVHRVIWILFNHNISEDLVIDHIDGDRLNNNISNLRLIRQEINVKNAKKYKTNKTGVPGITFRNINNWDYYIATWYNENRNRQSKAFSCNIYGYKTAFELAKDFRFKKMVELNNLGEGYTERHIYGG